LSSESSSYLTELLGCVETAEDLAAVEQLIAEQERQQVQQGRWICRTLAEVAEFFGMATQTVKQWRTESPPMPGTDGGYDLREVVRWRIDRLQGGTAKSAKQIQDLERGQVKLAAERLELEKLRESLVSRQEVEEWASVLLSETRELILQIPGAVSAVCALPDREAVYEQAENLIRDTLQTLHDRLTAYAETESDPSD
jgi:phage terminase Nu1 subunit (DNA packaging protein)